jgi:hypothetical protein
METKKCNLCEFETSNKKIFANHVRWNHKEQTFSEQGLAKLKQKKVFKINKNCICFRCNKSFAKELYEFEWKKLETNQNGRVYCSIYCANTRQHSQEEKEKIKKSLKDFYKDKLKPLINNLCKQCSRQFSYKRTRQFCSKICSTEFRKRKTKDLKAYRNECKFVFSLKEFPEEFDFDLVSKYGMYKAKNRGNNLNGVSRDHMVSVKYGYINNIDPKIIKHPANCKLILQEENFKKRENCSITLEELMIKIEKWNEKYGARGC